MKLITNNYITVIASALMLLASCTDGFEDLNTNPNQPIEVPTSSLFTGAERELVRSIFGNHQDLVGIGIPPMIYAQQVAGLRGGSDNIYAIVEDDFSEIYNRGLRDLEEIIRLNTDEATVALAALSGPNVNQIAVAKILKAWAYHNLTDVWGDIPYTQALKGQEYALPEYDTQEFIYMDLLNELTEASDMIDVNAGDISGDIIYGGDMAKWQKLANSLKMRVGLRLSEVAPTVASTAISEAFLAGVLSSNDDNASYKFLESAPNNNPWFYRFELSVPNYGVASTLVDMMESVNDPRLDAYADTSFNADMGGGFVGMPVGLDIASGSGISDFAVSWPDATNLLSSTSPFMIMTYSEVLFILSEASERGWITGSASTYYEEAITASIEQWGITDATSISDYLAQGSVAYDVANPLKSIGEQKWISFFMQGVQSWSEWRRLDYPTLEIAEDAVISDIPRRKGYPPSEINLNKANYDIAVGRQGPDNLLTRVWWDKQ